MHAFIKKNITLYIGGGIKKLFFLLSVKKKRGGESLGQIKKYLSENTQIFLTKGGGLTQSKKYLSDFLA